VSHPHVSQVALLSDFFQFGICLLSEKMISSVGSVLAVVILMVKVRNGDIR
jgi:hypothetical protein